MQNIVVKIVTILAVLALCIASISVKELRLGKDLRGGVSLIYKVDMQEDEPDPQGVLAQTIEVLKDRVNPKGVFDISMEPLGRDRLEIVMPLPNAEVREREAEFQRTFDELIAQSVISPSALDEALEQGDVAGRFAGIPGTARSLAIASLERAWEERSSSQVTYDQLPDDAEEADRRLAEQTLALSRNAYTRQYNRVLTFSLSPARVTRLLTLPVNPQLQRDRVTGRALLDDDGNRVFGESQRAIALENLKDEYGQLGEQVATVVDAFDSYNSLRTGFDDPEDLKRLLQGAGVLQFHIATSNANPEGVDINGLRDQLLEVGPENVADRLAGWYPINELKQWYDSPAELNALQTDPIEYFSTSRDLVAAVYEGTYYLLLWETDIRTMRPGSGGGWQVTGATISVDQIGRPAVSFRLNAGGASQMGRLTGKHIGSPMAIVLDNEVFSAPSIRSQITSDGQITGNFSQKEIQYLRKVLSAGALSASLTDEPISEGILGPSIGADNLERGREAFIIALIAVAIFMMIYYFFAGFIADLALLANGVIIFGVIMGIDGTFTLPGLAGIVLTVGMAVDANVLIYERIREEIFESNLDLRGCIREGYAKAISTILDANITNLIVCVVLFQTATAEVKGFALTLAIGICATLFTALFVTRQVYYLYTDLFKVNRLDMLPTVIPSIHRLLEPRINWIGMRRFFWPLSIVAVVGSLVLVSSRGVDMLDTEFRGGVSVTMVTAGVDADGDGAIDLDIDGKRIRLRLPHTAAGGIEDRVHAIGTAAPDPDTAPDDASRMRLLVLRELANAAVLTVGDTWVNTEGALTSSRYQIKVASPRGMDDDATITTIVVDAIVGEFGEELEITPPLSYEGMHARNSTGYLFPIATSGNAELQNFIGDTHLEDEVRNFIGGASIHLRSVSPPVDPAEVAARIRRMRNQPDFQRFSGRDVGVFGVTPVDATDPGSRYIDLLVMVRDEYRSVVNVDYDVWLRDVAVPEWQLVGKALQQPASLDQVSSYSSAIAQTLKARATVAVILSLLGILFYIWVRFGSLRYSLAAILALMHDVIIALGLLALSGVIGGTAIGSSLLIEPFQIDLGVVAALLTIIGYSLNDTIVILDRIRENRGKLPLPTAEIVNRSINQTFSRTLLTSMTTIIAVLIMYIEGGSGIRPFTFCLLTGLFVGTYSSIAIASPLVFSGKGSPPPGSREQGVAIGPEIVSTS